MPSIGCIVSGQYSQSRASGVREIGASGRSEALSECQTLALLGSQGADKQAMGFGIKLNHTQHFQLGTANPFSHKLLSFLTDSAHWQQNVSRNPLCV